MKNKKINIEILDANEDKLVVKLPFLEVPITMNYQFFKQRVVDGYFQFK